MVKFLGLLALAGAAAAILPGEDERYDPEQNFRPQNMTDLAYWIYAWTGSYYNGTTEFRLTPMDWGEEEDEKVCAVFEDETVSFSRKAILGVLKPNAEDKGDNTIMLRSSAWPDNLELWPDNDNSSPFPGQINEDIFHLESISPTHRGYTSGGPFKPVWNLTTRHLSEDSYSFSGSSNVGKETIQFNMSQCNSPEETWWGVTLETADGFHRIDAFEVTDPVISGRFDGRSAAFTLSGFFQANTDPPDSEDRSVLAGAVTVSFLGEIDEVRSDLLLAREDPEWTPTVGLNGPLLGDDESAAMGRGVTGLYNYVAGAVLGVVVLCYY